MYLVQNSNHAKVPTCEIILRCSEKSARWRLGLLLISPGSPPALGAVGPVLHCKLGWEKKSTNCVHQTYFIINYIQGCKTFGCLAARKWRENEKMKRKLRKNEEMERDLLSTFPHFLFISPLSIHFQIKNCLILPQNVKYGTFVTNVTKNLT